MPSLLDKSSRERELEKKIKDESDSHRRREMERQLDEMRETRERENRRIEIRRAEAEERKRERIAQQRLMDGSRFNLRYAGFVPSDIRPEDLVAALAPYVDFSFPAPGPPETRSRPADRTGAAAHRHASSQGDDTCRRGARTGQPDRFVRTP